MRLFPFATSGRKTVKKKAFNRGVVEARGTLFLPWDSDDAAVPHALETFQQHWHDILVRMRREFAGVCALCKDQHGSLIGSCFPTDIFDSDSLESRYRYKMTGEKWGFTRTEVLRRYPYPEDVVGHVPEGVVWSAIAKDYKTRFINAELRIYYKHEDSITQRGRQAAGARGNAEGHTLWARAILEEELLWFVYQPQRFLKMAANYTRFARSLSYLQPEKHYPIRKVLPKLLVGTMWPVGYLLYLTDRNLLFSTRPPEYQGRMAN